MTEEKSLIKITLRYDDRINPRSPHGSVWRNKKIRVPVDTRAEQILGFIKAESLRQLDPWLYEPLHEYEPSLTEGELEDHGIYWVNSEDYLKTHDILENDKFCSKLAKALK